MHTRGNRGNRGFLFIGSLLLLSAFLAYSSVITIRTTTQGMATDRLRDRVQATDLAQAAQEELRDSLYRFLSEDVYQTRYAGDAVQALDWLDRLLSAPTDPFPVLNDRNGDGKLTSADSAGGVDGTSGFPLCVTSLPTIKDINCAAVTTPLGAAQAVRAPRAWITSIARTLDATGNPSTDPLAARLMTIQAEAQVGAVTRRIQATYEVALGTSDVFRYAYFVNNFGWLDVRDPRSLQIFGDVRANGDFLFSGAGGWNMWVGGDVYAAKNPELLNPRTGLPSAGTINKFHHPWGWDYEPGELGTALMNSGYWNNRWTNRARPGKQLVLPGQVLINGQNTLLASDGTSFDPYSPIIQGHPNQWPGPARVPTYYPDQKVQPLPYLGDLSMYKSMALKKTTNTFTWMGRTFTWETSPYLWYWDNGRWQKIDGVRSDPSPLVLIGTRARPITIDGPIVTEGDVIVKGYVSGRGTLYTGRNVHVIGEITYANPPTWPRLERSRITGRVREVWGANMGTVCKDGTYFTQTETARGLIPMSCMQ